MSNLPMTPLEDRSSKHTPGPWSISDEIYVRDASRNGAYIAEVDPMTDFQGNEAEAQANLRLIAAAPAMFEALKAILSHANRAEITAKEWSAGLAALRLATEPTNER